jgi:hypothetical protein
MEADKNSRWSGYPMNLLTQASLPPSSSYRTIPLTQGQVAIVDACDYDRVSQFKWCAQYCPRSGQYYAVCHVKSEPGSKCRQRRIIMHRFLMNAPKGSIVDHINPAETLDNRRSCNLRFATNSQSQQNRRKQSNNACGFKGVSFDKHLGRYRAYVKADGQLIYLGSRSTPEAAHELYRAAALEYYGEYARLE